MSIPSIEKAVEKLSKNVPALEGLAKSQVTTSIALSIQGLTTDVSKRKACKYLVSDVGIEAIDLHELYAGFAKLHNPRKRESVTMGFELALLDMQMQQFAESSERVAFSINPWLLNVPKAVNAIKHLKGKYNLNEPMLLITEHAELTDDGLIQLKNLRDFGFKLGLAVDNMRVFKRADYLRRLKKTNSIKAVILSEEHYMAISRDKCADMNRLYDYLGEKGVTYVASNTACGPVSLDNPEHNTLYRHGVHAVAVAA